MLLRWLFGQPDGEKPIGIRRADTVRVDRLRQVKDPFKMAVVDFRQTIGRRTGRGGGDGVFH